MPKGLNDKEHSEFQKALQLRAQFKVQKKQMAEACRAATVENRKEWNRHRCKVINTTREQVKALNQRCKISNIINKQVRADRKL